MFDRFIRLARARKALRELRFEDALQLALDPVIAADRRAEEVRRAAGDELLGRARQRLAQGDLAAAKALAERVRAAMGEPAAEQVQAAVDAAMADQQAAVQVLRQAFGTARAAIERGDLTGAEALLAAHPTMPPGERMQLQAWLAERRRQASVVASHGEQRLAAGIVDDALEHLQRAEMLDRDHPEVVALRQHVAAGGAGPFARQLRAMIAAGDLPSALARHRAVVAALPSLRVAEPLREVAADLVGAVRAELCRQPTLAAAGAFARQVADAGLELSEATAALVEGLQAMAATGSVASGDVPERVVLVDRVAVAAEAVGARHLAQQAREQARAAASDGERLAAARALVDHGDLEVARARLTEILAEQPLHEGARRELELLEQSCADLDRRLAEARAAMRAGRLRQVCTLALALGGSARTATEAGQILTQARASMALVDRGLDEVRVSLHGRATATPEGLRHCLKRLEELAKVQSDHADLPAVADAVQAEITALEVWERAGQALAKGNVPEVLQGCSELLALRERLLTPERIESRLCDLADRLARFADVALVGGRLLDVERCADQVEKLREVRAEFAAVATRWRVAADERRAAARRLLAEARVRLGERDLADAERLVEEARLQWRECEETKAFAGELRLLRQQTDALERVEGMARERDFQGARQKMAAMPVTSPFLRTRIYDMKQNLARAQGLEGAFLLRVDEGGEQLVLRGESVTIGNVRQMRADLPVLANLAGRHASIRRSMSFHGGMQDSIVAEEGEVRVGGSVVTNRPLAPGDRVLLGPALGFVYQRPTGRSLTVGLVLQGGFQVAGTDRILLMKDRGRDGRILLGSGQDVHVRVAKATGEVEIFTTSTGQVRVACAQGGTIDGVPFQDEHPLAAGQLIEAAGISFHLLPWRPGT